MKRSLVYLLFIAILTVPYSCMTKCDCYPVPGPDKVSNYDFKKSIIETNSVNFATGFQTIASKQGLDSTSMAHLCQAVINPVRFFDDESGYFFVESNNAWMVAHATKPELIGTYRYDVTDIMGKYYVRDMVEAITYKGYGFVEYYFENPQTEDPQKKLSFVKSIPSAGFFMGTGFYDYNDWYYSTDETAMLLVESLTKSMSQGLSGGIEMMSDSMQGVLFCRDFIDNIRFFDNHSGYFFIYDFNCVNVAHGTQKNLQGQNLYDYQDSKGNYVIRDLVTITEDYGSGVYEYYWNNPVTGNEEPKIAYVYKLPGIDYLIGSGVYFE